MCTHGRRKHEEVRKHSVQPTINMEIEAIVETAAIALINYLQT